MGRRKEYRQRIKYQASSVKAKGLEDYLTAEICRRREMPREEARLVAADALCYLGQYGLRRKVGTIELPLISGRQYNARQKRQNQPEKVVSLTLLSEDDVDVLAEFGNRAMQTARMARMMEEAYAQDAVFDGPRLSLLFPLSLRAIRERLKGLWAQGALLPVAGTTETYRRQWRALRGVLAVQRYLSGESLTEIRQDLVISESLWLRWWSGFRAVWDRRDEDASTLAEDLGLPEPLVSGWQKLCGELPDTEVVRDRLAEAVSPGPVPVGRVRSPRAFTEHLVSRYGYSPAAAEYFEGQLYELARELNAKAGSGGQVLYFGVSSDEPPGTPLSEAQLHPVVLDYVVPEDWSLVDRDSPGALKWERLQRLVTGAYQQGAALSLPDIAYLLGLSTDAVANAMDDHDNVVLPTRGRVSDMGPTLSHAEKIIDLYMWGYTETEIKHRTGHSYPSIERYLIDFSRVAYLTRRGLPAPAIRQATGLSKRTVNKYVHLYAEYSGPDFAFRMARIMAIAEAHPKKAPINPVRGGEQMKKKKSRFATLADRSLPAVQMIYLRESFELAPQSHLAEAVCAMVNQAMEEYELKREEVRLRPGQLLVSHRGKPVILSLIDDETAQQLTEGLSPRAVRRHLEHLQLDQLQESDPEATVEQLWRLVGQAELARGRARSTESFVPPEPLDSSQLPVNQRKLSDMAVPQQVMDSVVVRLTDDYGLRPSMAEAMVQKAAAIRRWLCPLASELRPGQLVWMTHGTRGPRRGQKRWMPAVLTLLAPGEATRRLQDKDDLRQLKLAQIERITTEAWHQDAVLTSLDLEWLLGISQYLLRQLLDAYHAEHGVLLPTAGTVLDMGSTLTHKTIVVEMSLEGMTTAEISRRIFHTPEAVDSYLRTFDRVLILRYFGLPEGLMGRVTGHSPSLLKEHLKLAEKHFPTREQLADYLENRGVSLNEITASGT